MSKDAIIAITGGIEIFSLLVFWGIIFFGGYLLYDYFSHN